MKEEKEENENCHECIFCHVIASNDLDMIYCTSGKCRAHVACFENFHKIENCSCPFPGNFFIDLMMCHDCKKISKRTKRCTFCNALNCPEWCSLPHDGITCERDIHDKKRSCDAFSSVSCPKCNVRTVTLDFKINLVACNVCECLFCAQCSNMCTTDDHFYHGKCSLTRLREQIYNEHTRTQLHHTIMKERELKRYFNTARRSPEPLDEARSRSFHNFVNSAIFEVYLLDKIAMFL